MFEEKIQKKIAEKFQELNFINQIEIDDFKDFETFYLAGIKLAEESFLKLNLTNLHKKIAKQHSITREQEQGILESIQAIKSQHEFWVNLGHFTRNRLSVIRVLFKVTKNDETKFLIKKGMEVNQSISKYQNCTVRTTDTNFFS